MFLRREEQKGQVLQNQTWKVMTDGGFHVYF